MLAKGLSHKPTKEDEMLHLPRIQHSSSDSAADYIEPVSTPPRPPLIKANSFSEPSPHKPATQSFQPRTLNYRRKIRRSSLSDEIPTNLQLTPPTSFRNRSSSQNTRANLGYNASMIQIYGCLDNISTKLQIGNLSRTMVIHEIIQSITQVNIIISDNPRFLLMSNVTNKCFDIISIIFDVINFETAKLSKLRETGYSGNNNISPRIDNDIDFLSNEDEVISPIFNDLWMNTKLMLIKITNNSVYYNQMSLIENKSVKKLVEVLFEFITNCNTNEGDQIKDVLDGMYKRMADYRKMLFTSLLKKLLELLYTKDSNTNGIEKIDGLNRLLNLLDKYLYLYL